MNQSYRSSLAVGILLLVLGFWFLAQQLLPGFDAWVERYFDWPFIVVGVGLLFIVVAAATGLPDLAIPGSIIGGIGGLLAYQEASGNWESWAYAWTLIPGFVGVGIFIRNLLAGRLREAFSESGGVIFVSLVLFAIFGSFLGGPSTLGFFWPALLILLGLWLLVRSFFRPRAEP